MNTAQKYEHCTKKLRIWSHLLKKSLMENFIFCAVEDMANLTENSEFVKSEEKASEILSFFRLQMSSEIFLDCYIQIH